MDIINSYNFQICILKKQIKFADQATSLNTTRNPQIPQESQDPLPEQDFEMSPSSPTLLLRNIEKQVMRSKSNV